MNDLINGEQCRAARALLRMQQQALCDAANVTIKTLSDFESGKTKPYTRTVEAVQNALEAKGIQFIDGGATSANGGPGVRLRKPEA